MVLCSWSSVALFSWPAGTWEGLDHQFDPFSLNCQSQLFTSLLHAYIKFNACYTNCLKIPDSAFYFVFVYTFLREIMLEVCPPTVVL